MSQMVRDEGEIKVIQALQNGIGVCDQRLGWTCRLRVRVVAAS